MKPEKQMTTMNEPHGWDRLPLSAPLREALRAMALESPTDVQARAVPALVEGGDWQITAHTGSGKTLAYLLPSVERLLRREPPENPYRLSRPRLLVLAPTRELAAQIFAVCRRLIRELPLRVTLLTGGEDFGEQKKRLKRNPPIVVATPGRMLEHLQKESTDLSMLETLVLDEADRVLDMGFRDDVLAIAEHCGGQRQSIMLSATLHGKGLGGMRRALLTNPGSIVVDTVREADERVEHRILLSDDFDHKMSLTAALLGAADGGKTMVFINTRRHAEMVARHLQSAGIRCALLHGEIPHADRRRVIRLFIEGRIDSLIATDVAARGLDIPGVGRVINFDLPRSGDDYAHRAGRTGRAGARGVTLSLVGPREWNLMLSIQRYLGLRFARDTVAGLEARFQGPKKQKKSGKPVGRKTKKNKKAKKRAAEAAAKAPKIKKRLRDRKNIGKRRKPAAPRAPDVSTE